MRSKGTEVGIAAAVLGSVLAVVVAVGGGVLAGFLVSLAQAKWDKVAQEWEPYRLNEAQRQWFNTVRPKRTGPRCCDIADGHPTQAEHRKDGWYIPNPYHPDWDWVRVPDDAFTEGGSNPVGVATVWYGAQNGDGTPFIRCFVPESES